MKYPDGHFYSTIPDLKGYEPKAPSNLGVYIPLSMEYFLEQALMPYYRAAPFTAEKSKSYRYYYDNPAFSYNDGLALHGMIAHYQPKRIVEVGSGYSSAMMLDTKDIYSLATEIVHIEPYPEVLKSVAHPTDKLNLIEKKVQDVPIEEFTKLEANDLLFIDSSHVMKVGSDVQFLFFEVLPRLVTGVVVHFHDIFNGFEYCKEWLDKCWYWNEAYVLKAFLMCNHCYEVKLFNNYAGAKYRDLYERQCPICLKNIGGSLYLVKTSDPY